MRVVAAATVTTASHPSAADGGGRLPAPCGERAAAARVVAVYRDAAAKMLRLATAAVKKKARERALPSAAPPAANGCWLV